MIISMYYLLKRYAEVDGKFHFSLNVQDEMAIECYTKKSYSEAGTGFVAFTLTSKFICTVTLLSPFCFATIMLVKSSSVLYPRKWADNGSNYKAE